MTGFDVLDLPGCRPRLVIRSIWLAVLALSVLLGCNRTQSVEQKAATVKKIDPPERAIDQRFGTVISSPSPRWSHPPELTPIELPEIPLANAIWGATGRDDAGNVYLGVSCDGTGLPSATLCRIRPQASKAESLGDAVSNLRRLGLGSESTTQMKIHGKPVQANDGSVYFCSMDETGEKEDGSQLPIHGSHLWRINPSSIGPDTDDFHWEHLLAVPEAMIATGCTGRFVYMLGYFQHVVLQYDTQTGNVRRTIVGSVGGHVSRNFLVDLNEHLYVPRVSRSEHDGFDVALVELDTELKEVTSHSLADYGATKGFDSHGITGFATLESGDILFTTPKGILYRITPSTATSSKLTRLGWIHPEGESHPAFLCCPDGGRTVCGFTRRDKNRIYQWFTYDLESGQTKVLELSDQSRSLLERPNTLIYGSNTRDDQGNAFAVGWFKQQETGGFQPHAMRVHWPELANLSAQ